MRIRSTPWTAKSHYAVELLLTPCHANYRRRFIQSGLGCVIGMSESPNLSFAEARSGAIPIAFQLYTVRGEFSRDVPGTLKTLGEIGYKAVEFWGYGGTPNVYQNYSAPQLRGDSG
jgi:hypothetical protein